MTPVLLSIEPGSLTMPLGTSFTLSWTNISDWYDATVEIDDDFGHSFGLAKDGGFVADPLAYVCSANASQTSVSSRRKRAQPCDTTLP